MNNQIMNTIFSIKENLLSCWFFVNGNKLENSNNEYEESYNAWYLVENEGEGYSSISEYFILPNINKDQIKDAIKIFSDSNDKFNIFNLTYDWQACNIQKFIPTHTLDLSKYYYQITLKNEPRYYTMNGVRKLAAKNAIHLLRSIICDASLHYRTHDDVLECLQLIDNFKSYAMRETRQYLIHFILWKNISIDDDKLLRYLEDGLNDRNHNINELARQTVVEGLVNKKLDLYDIIKNKYDLYLIEADPRIERAGIVKYILLKNINADKKKLKSQIEDGLNDSDPYLRLKMKEVVINELKHINPNLYSTISSLYDLSLSDDVIKKA